MRRISHLPQWEEDCDSPHWPNPALLELRVFQRKEEEKKKKKKRKFQEKKERKKKEGVLIA